MKKFKSLLGISALFLALSSLNMFSNEKHQVAYAEGNTTYTKALAKEGVADSGVGDAFIYFKLSENDYTFGDAYQYAPNLPHYRVSDYNFTSHIEFSKDSTNYIPLSELANGTNFFFNNGTFRFGISHDAKGYDFVNYPYIKILEGCEFPSYDYCANGGTIKKFVQEETTLSKIEFRNDISETCVAVAYGEQSIYTGDALPFGGPSPYWNNVNYADANYRQVILQFGTYMTDYFSNSHLPDASEQATALTEIGQNLTINGVPAYKLREIYPLTSITYAHGYNYMFINYPLDILKITKDYLLPTIHIPEGTKFIDNYCGETTMTFVGDTWSNVALDGFTIQNPDDLKMAMLFDMPFQYDTDAKRIIADLREDGCRLQMNFNTGDNNATDSGAVTNFVLYGITISIMQFQSVVALYDVSGALAQVYYGITIKPNTDYNLEVEIVAGVKNTVKIAINHAVVIDAELSSLNTAATDVWTINPQGTWTLDYFKEINAYSPVISFDGSAYYEFFEGDPVYNFASLVNVYDIYGTSSSEYHVSYDYQEGAVTNGKYNAGTWTLTITLNALGYDPVTKVITLNIHGLTAMAKVYFDGGEALEVPVGSKLVAPQNPDTYHDDDFDYVFNGWYFEGAKWNFETDTVQGDMHLVSNFVKVERHYNVTVKFEGINRPNETYSISKNTALPFALFEVEGASFVVFNGEIQISSLTVTNDVTIVVKYTVFYQHHDMVMPTCDQEGNREYWTSVVYPGVYFADANGYEVIDNITLTRTPHSIIHVDAVESTCTEEGNIDCYYCTSCRRFFSDAEGLNEIENYKTPKKQHILTYHEGHEATCELDGQKEYWTCANEPGVYYGDEACEETLDTIVIPATGHDYQEPTYTWNEVENGFECVARTTCSHCNEVITEIAVASKSVTHQATCTEEGQITYTVVFKNSKFTTQTKLVSTPMLEHDYVHFDETPATKESNGIKEHYECSMCHKCFLKENNAYVEITPEQLVLTYKAKGCGGSIETFTFTSLAAIGGASILFFLKSRKEEK